LETLIGIYSEKFYTGKLSFLEVRRHLSKAGAKRVSTDGVKEMIRVMNDVAIKVGKEAIVISRNYPQASGFIGRKTITAEDIILAYLRVFNGQDLQ
jgi:histone H3/H4